MAPRRKLAIRVKQQGEELTSKDVSILALLAQFPDAPDVPEWTSSLSKEAQAIARVIASDSSKGRPVRIAITAADIQKWAASQKELPASRSRRTKRLSKTAMVNGAEKRDRAFAPLKFEDAAASTPKAYKSIFSL